MLLFFSQTKFNINIILSHSNLYFNHCYHMLAGKTSLLEPALIFIKTRLEIIIENKLKQTNKQIKQLVSSRSDLLNDLSYITFTFIEPQVQHRYTHICSKLISLRRSLFFLLIENT